MAEPGSQPRLSRRDIRFTVGPSREVQLAGFPVFADDCVELWGALSELRAIGGRHLIVTLNVDQVVDLATSSTSQDAFIAARLRLLDGMPLVWTSRLLGARGASRNTGADLLPQAAALSSREGWRLVVLGGGPLVADRAARVLAEKNVGAEITAVDFPFVTDLTDPSLGAVADEIAALQPDIVFICLGAPKQEQWFLEWRDRLPDAIYVGAGAAIDFAAGMKRRAPRAIQSAGLEWLWRLGQEPRRLFRRYVVKSAGFLPVLLRSVAHHRR